MAVPRDRIAGATGGTVRVPVAPGPNVPGYDIIQVNGVPILPARDILNLIGIGIVGADDPVGLRTNVTFLLEQANAIRLGGASADPATPLTLNGPATYWPSPVSTPAFVPNVKSNASVWSPSNNIEIYGLATVQTAGVGAVARPYQILLNDAPIGAAVQNRTPASAGFVRIADFAPVAVPAGSFITCSLTLQVGDTVRNPLVFVYARPTS